MGQDKKVVVLGLDGVSYFLIKELIKIGYMPNLSSIINDKLISIETVLPEISSVSWTTFMTGVNPGEHGIYGFVDLKENSYEYKINSFYDLKYPTLFDGLKEINKRAIVINLPATYPARAIPGVLISGFVAVDLKRAIYPNSIYPFLESIKYKIDVDLPKVKEEPSILFEEVKKTLSTREKVLYHFWKNYEWDLFVFIITVTDRINHFWFKDFLDSKGEYNQAFKESYKKIDEIIGKLYELYNGIKEEKELFILSDHGFTKIEREVYINNILKREGFLKLEEGKDSLVYIKEGTKAFALDPSRIYINLEGKYPKGSVSEKDYRKVIEDIVTLFKDYRIDGKKIIKRVFLKEEIYHGREIDKAPDIILLSEEGFDLKAKIFPDNRLYGNSWLTGMHTYDNAIFFNDRGRVVKNIIEVKALIEKALKGD